MSINVRSVEVHTWAAPTRIPDADYVINPYVGCPHACRYCYACFMKRFSPHKESWGNFLDVKTCSKPLDFKRLRGKRVLFSSVTDAYNPFEAKFQVTRKLLESMIGEDIAIEILTKSDLVLRDLDILKRLKSLRVAFSIHTMDESFRSLMDKASPIERRMRALQVLHENGIYTILFISPFFPYITDFKDIIEHSCSFVDEYFFENLSLRSPFKSDIMQCIRTHYPELYDRYVEIFSRKKRDYWMQLAAEIRNFCTERHVKYTNFFHHGSVRKPESSYQASWT